MTQVADQHFVDTLNTAPELLTTEEVAQIFRVTQATVLRWVAQQELKCVQVGPRLHRFPKWCIEEYLSTTAKSAHHQ
jgi:excisionase family DNA binding protein